MCPIMIIKLPLSPTPSVAEISSLRTSSLLPIDRIRMLTNRSSPMIDRVSKLLIPSSKYKLDHTRIAKANKSPIRYNVGVGIGLGIFAALERSAHVAGSGNRIPVHNYGGMRALTGLEVKDYAHRKVDNERGCFNEKVMGCDVSDAGMMNKKCLFSLPPSPWRIEECDAFPSHQFLTCCDFCRKKLCGKDIYMYRGEKGFCSEECRAVQIAKDERREGRRSGRVSGSLDVAANSSSLAYDRDKMLPAGIFAI